MAKGDSIGGDATSGGKTAGGFAGPPKMDQYSVMHRMFDHFSPGANRGITPQPVMRTTGQGINERGPMPMQQYPIQQMPDMTNGSDNYNLPQNGGGFAKPNMGSLAPTQDYANQLFGGSGNYGGGNPQQAMQQQQQQMGMAGGSMAPSGDINQLLQQLMGGGSNGFLDPSRYGGGADPRFNY